MEEAKVAAVKKRVTGGTDLMYCSGVERIAIATRQNQGKSLDMADRGPS